MGMPPSFLFLQPNLSNNDGDIYEAKAETKLNQVLGLERWACITLMLDTHFLQPRRRRRG